MADPELKLSHSTIMTKKNQLKNLKIIDFMLKINVLNSTLKIRFYNLFRQIFILEY